MGKTLLFIIESLKNEYVTFSRSCQLVVPSLPIINKTAFKHKHKTRFLGVIIDESPNWTGHFQISKLIYWNNV